MTQKPSLIYSDSDLMMAAILECLPCWTSQTHGILLIQTPMLSSLRFTFKNTLTHYVLWIKLIQLWLKLIHSHLTSWRQPSWILPYWIQPSWIQPFCTKLWLKLIHLDSNSFILTQLDDGSHLKSTNLGFNHFAQNKLHLFILTQLDDGSHAWILLMLDSDSDILDSDTLLIISQIHSKTLSLQFDFWLKLIHFHLTWW